jgi:hypothetical protein
MGFVFVKDMQNIQDNLQDLTKCTVAIRNSIGDDVLGTGVIVTDDGLILTCYHVVEDVKSGTIHKTVHISLPSAPDIKRLASPLEKYYDSELDIAFLQLQESFPDNVTVADLGEMVSPTHSFVGFGFRKAREFNGLHSNGGIMGKINKIITGDSTSSPSLIQLESKQIAPGMSGSPILDTKINRVIGIVSERYRTQGDMDKDLSLGIPVDSIIKVYPILTQKNAGLQKDRRLAVNSVESVYKRQYHAFLSRAYLNKTNKTIANNLYNWLRDAVHGFKGEERIYYHEPELSLQKSKVLADVIPNCRSIIVLLSRDSVSKGWVREEYDAAKHEKELFEDFTIIPVLIEKCDIPEFIDKDTLIELGDGGLDLDTSKDILERMYYHQRTNPRVEQARDLYISRGWRDGEKPLAESICTQLDEQGFRLIGEAEDRATEKFNPNRIESVISSCGGFVAIVPYRPENEESKTSKYIINEIVIAKKLLLPMLIIADPRVLAYLEKSLAEQSIPLTMETAEGSEHKTLINEIKRISDEWKEPLNLHYVFYAMDDNNLKRREAIRHHIELITSMTCKMTTDFKYKVHQMATHELPNAYLVIADISDNNLNMLISSAIARGALVARGADEDHLRLVALRSSDGKINVPSMLNDIGIDDYGDDMELLQKVHQIAYEFRRRILNYELPSRVLRRV